MRRDLNGSLAAVAAVRVVSRRTGMYRVRHCRTEVTRRRSRIVLISGDDRTQLPRSNYRRRATLLQVDQNVFEDNVTKLTQTSTIHQN